MRDIKVVKYGQWADVCVAGWPRPIIETRDSNVRGGSCTTTRASERTNEHIFGLSMVWATPFSGPCPPKGTVSRPTVGHTTGRRTTGGGVGVHLYDDIHRRRRDMNGVECIQALLFVRTKSLPLQNTAQLKTGPHTSHTGVHKGDTYINLKHTLFFRIKPPACRKLNTSTQIIAYEVRLYRSYY